MKFKIFIRFIAGFVGIIIVYLLLAYIFSLITINGNFREVKTSGIEIHILSNGVHTDLVLPYRSKYKDWSKQIKTIYTLSKDTNEKYIGFGWGDREFYLNTPEWSDLKFSTAFKALFFLSGTALHVTFYRDLSPDNRCREVFISTENYLKMVEYIENSFQKDANGNVELIRHHSFGQDDCFFEAKGVFSLFTTCNTWTNRGLKYSGMKACLWTPFDRGILYQYRRK
ncbi:MAG: TIGR02117 family protein [Bacteroidota bacterium]|nr:TIGR02117 family protein [Bacteroidota bacterium]